jgi:hypothetical protein
VFEPNDGFQGPRGIACAAARGGRGTSRQLSLTASAGLRAPTGRWSGTVADRHEHKDGLRARSGCGIISAMSPDEIERITPSERLTSVFFGFISGMPDADFLRYASRFRDHPMVRHVFFSEIRGGNRRRSDTRTPDSFGGWQRPRKK